MICRVWSSVELHVCEFQHIEFQSLTFWTWQIVGSLGPLFKNNIIILGFFFFQSLPRRRLQVMQQNHWCVYYKSKSIQCNMTLKFLSSSVELFINLHTFIFLRSAPTDELSLFMAACFLCCNIALSSSTVCGLSPQSSCYTSSFFRHLPTTLSFRPEDSKTSRVTLVPLCTNKPITKRDLGAEFF